MATSKRDSGSEASRGGGINFSLLSPGTLGVGERTAPGRKKEFTFLCLFICVCRRQPAEEPAVPSQLVLDLPGDGVLRG